MKQTNWLMEKKCRIIKCILPLMPITMPKLVRKSKINYTTVFRNINLFRKYGFISMKKEHDMREYKIRLSEKGILLQKEIDNIYNLLGEYK